MSYRDQPWENRFNAMGDQAESAFEQYADEILGKRYVRYGLNRPPLQIARLPARVRYTPDFLMSHSFVEVQGLGKDQTFKVKFEKLGALHYWNDLRTSRFDGVSFFIHDSYNARNCLLSLTDLDRVIGQHGSLATFAEGKPYFSVPADEVFDAAQT